MEDDSHELVKQLAQKEHLYKRELAVLRQQLELTKLELADTKERETNSRNAYSLLLRTMNEMSFAGNESLLKSLQKEVMILKQAKNEDTEILKHKCDEIVNIVQSSIKKDFDFFSSRKSSLVRELNRIEDRTKSANRIQLTDKKDELLVAHTNDAESVRNENERVKRELKITEKHNKDLMDIINDLEIQVSKMKAETDNSALGSYRTMQDESKSNRKLSTISKIQKDLIKTIRDWDPSVNMKERLDSIIENADELQHSETNEKEEMLGKCSTCANRMLMTLTQANLGVLFNNLNQLKQYKENRDIEYSETSVKDKLKFGKQRSRQTSDWANNSGISSQYQLRNEERNTPAQSFNDYNFERGAFNKEKRGETIKDNLRSIGSKAQVCKNLENMFDDISPALKNHKASPPRYSENIVIHPAEDEARPSDHKVFTGIGDDIFETLRDSKTECENEERDQQLDEEDIRELAPRQSSEADVSKDKSSNMQYSNIKLSQNESVSVSKAVRVDSQQEIDFNLTETLNKENFPKFTPEELHQAEQEMEDNQIERFSDDDNDDECHTIQESVHSEDSFNETVCIDEDELGIIHKEDSNHRRIRESRSNDDEHLENSEKKDEWHNEDKDNDYQHDSNDNVYMADTEFGINSKTKEREYQEENEFIETNRMRNCDRENHSQHCRTSRVSKPNREDFLEQHSNKTEENPTTPSGNSHSNYKSISHGKTESDEPNRNSDNSNQNFRRGGHDYRMSFQSPDEEVYESFANSTSRRSSGKKELTRELRPYKQSNTNSSGKNSDDEELLKASDYNSHHQLTETVPNYNENRMEIHSSSSGLGTKQLGMSRFENTHNSNSNSGSGGSKFPTTEKGRKLAVLKPIIDHQNIEIKTFDSLINPSKTDKGFYKPSPLTKDSKLWNQVPTNFMKFSEIITENKLRSHHASPTKGKENEHDAFVEQFMSSHDMSCQEEEEFEDDNYYDYNQIEQEDYLADHLGEPMELEEEESIDQEIYSRKKLNMESPNLHAYKISELEPTIQITTFGEVIKEEERRRSSACPTLLKEQAKEERHNAGYLSFLKRDAKSKRSPGLGERQKSNNYLKLFDMINHSRRPSNVSQGKNKSLKQKARSLLGKKSSTKTPARNIGPSKILFESKTPEVEKTMPTRNQNKSANQLLCLAVESRKGSTSAFSSKRSVANSRNDASTISRKRLEFRKGKSGMIKHVSINLVEEECEIDTDQQSSLRSPGEEFGFITPLQDPNKFVSPLADGNILGQRALSLIKSDRSRSPVVQQYEKSKQSSTRLPLSNQNLVVRKGPIVPVLPSLSSKLTRRSPEKPPISTSSSIVMMHELLSDKLKDLELKLTERSKN